MVINVLYCTTIDVSITNGVVSSQSCHGLNAALCLTASHSWFYRKLTCMLYCYFMIGAINNSLDGRFECSHLQTQTLWRPVAALMWMPYDQFRCSMTACIADGWAGGARRRQVCGVGW